MPRQPRRQYFVNSKVQGSLALRVGVYWLYCLVAVALMNACWLVLFDRPASSGEFAARIWHQTVPTLLGTLLLLPIVMMDCVRFSNRFVGPIFRLGRALDRLADGQRVHNVEFRSTDFWYEYALSFNRLNERVIALEEQLKATPSIDETASPEEQPVAVG